MTRSGVRLRASWNDSRRHLRGRSWASSTLGLHPFSARIASTGNVGFSLERTRDLEMAEADLFKTLSTLLHAMARPAREAREDGRDLEPRVQSRLEAHGLHALLGLTPPLSSCCGAPRAKRTTSTCRAAPSTCASRCWMGSRASAGRYATCDYYHSAGWTETGRLYCVRPSYDLDSESFRVSYLAHEGQHFADKRRFPNLEAPELEYRAKLVEISRAETTLEKLLQGFGANVSDNRDQPHSFANARLLRDLAGAVLGGSPTRKLLGRPSIAPRCMRRHCGCSTKTIKSSR